MILGIDAGAHGAVAFLPDDGDIWVSDMPTVAIPVNKSVRDRVDAAGLAALLRDLPKCRAYVEKVGPRPHDTPMTAGYLMEAYGIVLGVLGTLGISVTPISPQMWRRVMGVKLGPGSTYKERKEASRVRALQMFPSHAKFFARKLDADRAEAVLIGECGRMEAIQNMKGLTS